MATTINDILHEIRLKATTEREKGTDFERLMKLWFLTNPRYSELEKVWLWEEFPCHRTSRAYELFLFSSAIFSAKVGDPAENTKRFRIV